MNRKITSVHINQSAGSSIKDLKQFPMLTLTYSTLAPERSMIGDKSTSLIGTLFVLLGERDPAWLGKCVFLTRWENCTFLLVQITLAFAQKFHPVKGPLFEPQICGLLQKGEISFKEEGKSLSHHLIFSGLCYLHENQTMCDCLWDTPHSILSKNILDNEKYFFL